MTESFKIADTPETRGVAGEEFRDGLVANYLCATTPDGEEKALKALRKDEFRLAMVGMTPEQRELWNNLDKVDWKAVQREGLTAVMPALFGGYIGLTSSPEDATRIATALGGAGFGFEMLSVAAAVPEAMARHKRASGLAKVIAAVRVGTFYAGKVGLFTALGTGVAGLVHRGWEAQAAQPVAANGGEGFNNPHPGPRPVDGSTGQIGGLSPEDRGVGAGIQPPAAAEQATAQAAEVAAEAAEAARQVAEALKESQLAAAPVGITGGELSGGTIWGNELEFVKQLGVHHVEPVTNLLKNFSQVLAQAQPPTEIGPTDTAYVINRDVAGWAAEQADKLYGMDPSSMTSWQKALWEIGRGLRGANWRDLQAVTEEFVRQAKP